MAAHTQKKPQKSDSNALKDASGAAVDPSRKVDQEQWELVKTLAVSILLALFFRSILFEPFRIPSGSMKETLLIGDYIFVSKYSYGYSRYSFPFGLPLFDGRVFATPPKRGDIVVFREPSHPKIDFVKRLIGLPGDHVQVKGGVLYLNNKAVPRTPAPDFVEPGPFDSVSRVTAYTETLPNGVSYHVLDQTDLGDFDNTQEFVVPEGHYFMMGDNRDNSNDSRSQEVGFVPQENLIGRTEIIWFSTDGVTPFWHPVAWVKGLRYSRFFHRVS